jgi:predicted ATPase
MVLTKVTITDFLSVRGSISFDLDGHVTTLLGANDHGKTNILRAIECLNFDRSISEDERNWDAKGRLPAVAFELKLSSSELTELDRVFGALSDFLMEKLGLNITKPDGREDEAAETQTPIPAQVKQASPLGQQSAIPQLKREEAEVDPSEMLDRLTPVHARIKKSRRVVLTRSGVGEPLRWDGTSVDGFPVEVFQFLENSLPRVELFTSQLDALKDTVQVEQIDKDAYEFMQGIFYYAGLDPLNCKHLFEQNLETGRELDIASTRLDLKLRDLWAQGAELGIKFHLRHHEKSIELYADDPSVVNRKTRLSQRSSGVTQFFRLSMVLHARRKKYPANSYIYLFDEPGIFLHPKGQKDLIQVFEELSCGTQIVYATHSLFLLNQNFPERHRLVIRDEQGTKIDQKPYRNNWNLALQEMVGSDANIIFAPCVLLVEGDSDHFYIRELLRHFNRLGFLDVDINMLGIYSYRDHQNLRYLIQTLLQRESTKMLVLFDGDKMGKSFYELTEKLCEAHSTVKRLKLPPSLAIEDYALFENLFVEAAFKTLGNAVEVFGAAKSSLGQAFSLLELKDSWNNRSRSSNSATWFRVEAERLVGKAGASKVALARNYALLVEDQSSALGDKSDRESRCVELCTTIKRMLSIPGIRALKTIEEKEILKESTVAVSG